MGKKYKDYHKDPSDDKAYTLQEVRDIFGLELARSKKGGVYFKPIEETPEPIVEAIIIPKAKDYDDCEEKTTRNLDNLFDFSDGGD